MLGPQHVERRLQERAAVDLVGGAVGRDERKRLVTLEAVTLDGAEDRVLALRWQRTQRMRQRRADATLRHLTLGLDRKVPADGDAARHPGELPSQPPPYRSLGESIVFDEGENDAGLVQGRHGARRSIGPKQEVLVLHTRRGALYDNGDLRVAVFAPGVKALEAVENLVGAVVTRSDADGKCRRQVWREPRRPWTQGRVTLAQAVDREERDASRRRTAGRVARHDALCSCSCALRKVSSP